MMRWMMPGVAFAAVIVGIVVAYQSAAIGTRAGSGAPVYSARRHDPYGTAALQDLLAERGIPVRTLERPSLEPGDRGVLIQVLPRIHPGFEGQDLHLPARQITDWILQGNTVLQLTRAPTDLMTRFKITPTTQPADTDKVEEFESAGGLPDQTPGFPYHAHWDSSHGDDPALHPIDGKRILLSSPMRFVPTTNPAWTPLATLTLDHDAVVAGEYRAGKGRLILVGAPTPALNETLGEEANLDLILAIVGKGPVIIDEWSHGIGHEATVIGFLHDAGLVPVLFQLVFLAALYVWSTSGYRRQVPTPAPRRRSSIEQIETLGFLYSRALNPDVTYERINLEVQRRLAEGLRCQPREIKARLAGLTPALRGQIESLSARLNATRPAHGPRCQACGYELHKNVTGRCPECGTGISAHVQRDIIEFEKEIPTGVERRRSVRDAEFAEILRDSHELMKEAQRERRGSR